MCDLVAVARSDCPADTFLVTGVLTLRETRPLAFLIIQYPVPVTVNWYTSAAYIDGVTGPRGPRPRQLGNYATPGAFSKALCIPVGVAGH